MFESRHQLHVGADYISFAPAFILKSRAHSFRRSSFSSATRLRWARVRETGRAFHRLRRVFLFHKSLATADAAAGTAMAPSDEGAVTRQRDWGREFFLISLPPSSPSANPPPSSEGGTLPVLYTKNKTGRSLCYVLFFIFTCKDLR